MVDAPHIGIVGTGRMGANIARRLNESVTPSRRCTTLVRKRRAIPLKIRRRSRHDVGRNVPLCPTS